MELVDAGGDGDDALRDVLAFMDALPPPEWTADEPGRGAAHGPSALVAASASSEVGDVHAAAHAAEAGVVSDFLEEILLPLEGAGGEDGAGSDSVPRGLETATDWDPPGCESVALNGAALVPVRGREIVPSLPPPRDATSANATKRKKRQWNPNKARDERRDEIVYLRNTVQTLSAKLKALQAETTAAGTGTGVQLLTAAAVSYPSDDDLEPPKDDACVTLELSSEQKLAQVPRNVWRDVALRQRHARSKAERENVRLKLVLEDQLKVAKRWEKMLLRKSAVEGFEKSVFGNFSRQADSLPLTVPGRTDADIFDELLAGLDEVYAMTNTVMRESGLAHQEGKCNDAQFLTDRETGNISLRIYSSNVLPFDMHSTASAAWTHFVFRKNNIPHRFYKLNFAKSVDTTEGTAVENYSLQIDVRGTTARLGVKRASRRYFEEDRIVIVFRTIFNPIELAEELLTGVSFRVTGYIVARRPKTILDGNYSLLQLSYTYTPVMGLDHPKVGDMTDFMMRAAESYFTTSHELIENILLTQATDTLEGWCFDD